MKFLSSFSADCLIAFPAYSDVTEKRHCMELNFPVEATSTPEITLATREVSVLIANTSDQPIGGIWIDFVIEASDRPTPLYDGSIREATSIPGGLLPGESLTASDFHFMDERALAIAKASPSVTVSAVVQNVTDTQMQGLFQYPSMVGWADRINETLCQ